MKKITPFIALLLTLVMLTGSFAACLPESVPQDQGTTPVVTTPQQTTPDDTTTPVATDPAVTDPAVTDPAVTDPVVTDPVVTDPVVTDPVVTDPVVTDPVVTNPPEDVTPPDEPVELDKNCAHLFTTRKVLVQVTTQADGKIANVCGKCGGWQEEILPAVKSLKVLAIGNSFSDDGMEYLAMIAKAAGIEEIVLGNLYIGGCSLATHYDNANTNNPNYIYRKNVGDGWVSTSKTAIDTALTDEEWTIITMQQVSQNSGLGHTIQGSTPDFPYLSSLIATIQGKFKYKFKYETTPKIYWHMTWAYAESSTHSGFANYGNDQMTMYNAIVNTVKETISPFFSKKGADKKITGFIPSGTAIQNLRSSYFEDAMVTRDGYHLSYTTGRFVAGLTWLRALTGLSIDELDFSGDASLAFLTDDWEMLKESVNNAYLNPYEVTQSQYTTDLAVVPELEPLPDAPAALDANCDHLFTRRKVLVQVTTTTDGKIANVCGKCGGWQEETLPAVKSLKILAIGNSFSDDAMEYLAIIAKAAGIEEIVLGKLYVGGCTIDGHWSRAQSGSDYERFDLNLGNGWVTQSTKTLLYALGLYDWDIITMQQGSPVSGVPGSLTNLQNLIEFVHANKTNPDAKLYWHMTWAYAKNSEHSGFPTYGRYQLGMYNAIVNTVKEAIAPFFNPETGNQKITGIIPSGTTIQNIRTSYFEDANITRDGYHLSNTGRFAAGLTWLRTLTGLSIDELDFSGVEGLEFLGNNLPMIKESVNNAYLNPYARTQSQYTTNSN